MMTGAPAAACTMTLVSTIGPRSGEPGGRRRHLVVVLGLLASILVLATALGVTFGTGSSATGALRASGASGATPPASSLAEAVPGLSGVFELKLDDEFDGSKLDTSLWHTCYSWGCTISPADAPATNANPENEWYEAANVAQRDGSLVLTATPRSAHGRNYTSGMIQSNGNFDFTYGVIEVRAKVPAGSGTWPAVWLVPANQSWPPEIDVMEYWGAQPDQVRVSLHYGSTDQVEDRVVNSTAFADQWHTYAVDWAPGSISWYIDGQLVYRVDRSVSELMYPIVNLAVADPPTPAASTFPASFEVDWIRIYQQSGVGPSTCQPASCIAP